MPRQTKTETAQKANLGDQNETETSRDRSNFPLVAEMNRTDMTQKCQSW